jgi:hypothetical protein
VLRITTNNQKYDISYQLGAYYDMRYSGYFTRTRFILGLSEYNEDDTLYEREEMYKESFPDHNLSIFLVWELQEEERKKRKRDYSLADSHVKQVFKEMCNAQKKDPYDKSDIYDKIVNEYILNTYFDIDEQGLNVCKAMIWAMWDLHSGNNFAHYSDVVEFLLSPEYQRRDIFTTIKDIEVTIQRLILMGILSQDIDRIGDIDKDGNVRRRLDQPFITLSFSKDPGEVMVAIGETFSQEMYSFFGLHNNYDV